MSKKLKKHNNDPDKTTEQITEVGAGETAKTKQPENAEANTTAPETGVQEELPTVSDENNSQSEGSAENTEVDTPGETGSTSETGSETGSETVTDEEPTDEKKSPDEIETVSKQLFLDNPLKETIYFSSDFIPFFNKSDAYKYAGTLPYKSVITIKRR